MSKMSYDFVKSLIFSAPLSLMIFGAFYFFTLSISSPSVDSSKKDLVVSSSFDFRQQHNEIKKCAPSESDEWVPGALSACFNNVATEKLAQEKPLSKRIEFFSFIILTFIWFCLNTQIAVFLTLRSKKYTDKFLETSLALSEWSINSPPMLGVIGTIMSFSLLVSQTESGISSVFNTYFMAAATTTIFGGIVYIINLLLGVGIYPLANKKVYPLVDKGS